MKFRQMHFILIIALSGGSAALAQKSNDPASSNNAGCPVCQLMISDSQPAKLGTQSKTVNKAVRETRNICGGSGPLPYYVSGDDNLDGEPKFVINKTLPGERNLSMFMLTLKFEEGGDKGRPMCQASIVDQSNAQPACGNPQVPVGRRLTLLMDMTRRSSSRPQGRPLCEQMQRYFEDSCGPDIGKDRKERIKFIRQMVDKALDAYPVDQAPYNFPNVNHLVVRGALSNPNRHLTAAENKLNSLGREAALLCLMSHESLSLNPIKASGLTCKEEGHTDFGLGQLVRASVVDIIDRTALQQSPASDKPKWYRDVGREDLSFNTGLDVFNNLGQNIGLQIQVIALFLESKWGSSLGETLARYHGSTRESENRHYAGAIMGCYNKLMSSNKKYPGVLLNTRLSEDERDDAVVEALNPPTPRAKK